MEYWSAGEQYLSDGLRVVVPMAPSLILMSNRDKIIDLDKLVKSH